MRVVITGSSGQLGHDLLRAFNQDEVIGLDGAGCDLRHRDDVLGLVTTVAPDVIVHAGAWTDVDGCEGDPDRAWAVNALGSRHVAEAARLTDAYLCAVSTDYVFDGRQADPYVEWATTNPLGVYGRTKLGGEREVLAGAPGASVVRTSWLCGVGGPNFVTTMLRLSGASAGASGGAAAGGSGGGEVKVVADQRGCPTFAADLAVAIRRLVAARLPGVFHITNQGATTWFDLAQAVFSAAGRDPSLVKAISTAELDPPRAAPRPANSVLDNAALRLSGLELLADWHDPLERLVKELSA